MKKHILLLSFIICSLGASAQNRKYIGNFSQVRQYYNPALTGQEGSRLTTLYRNQWTGFEDAPTTLAASAELQLSDFTASKGYRFSSEHTDRKPVQHGIGMFLLRDSFGPYSETQANLSYSSGVNLSESLLLRWGTALTYTALSLDGNKLTIDRQDDPKYSNLLGQKNRSGKLDLNLGLTLAADNFYVGYSLQNITQGKLIATSDEFNEAFFGRRHVALAGARAHLNQSIDLVLNSLYQHDAENGSTIEGQLKAVYQNTFWVGAGYRNKLAYSATAGLSLGRLGVSYLYEAGVADAATIARSTNELSLSYHLKPRGNTLRQKTGRIW
ncbi:MAG TPA: PorP/SprF family type IX secretion system membrane protein [Pontibacter sp.]